MVTVPAESSVVTTACALSAKGPWRSTLAPKGGDDRRSLCADILPAVQELHTRLTRLDALLPRYQRTMTAVYELLRIRAMDEVIPAVQQLLRASR